MTVTRRQMVCGAAIAPVALGACTSLLGPGASAARDGTIMLPTVGDEAEFFAKCIRCFRCAEVCTTGCIEFHPFWAAPELAGTPYIRPRVAGCNTCMRCTQVCPTGALTPTSEEPAVVLEEIDMGKAYVDKGLCLSFIGRVCGVCHDACPYPAEAIHLRGAAKPEVMEGCVGCGRCEERCPQVPAAIRVFREDPGVRWMGPEEWSE
jgi:ferredoxin-type protein NapG